MVPCPCYCCCDLSEILTWTPPQRMCSPSSVWPRGRLSSLQCTLIREDVCLCACLCVLAFAVSWRVIAAAAWAEKWVLRHFFPAHWSRPEIGMYPSTCSAYILSFPFFLLFSLKHLTVPCCTASCVPLHSFVSMYITVCVCVCIYSSFSLSHCECFALGQEECSEVCGASSAWGTEFTWVWHTENF